MSRLKASDLTRASGDDTAGDRVEGWLAPSRIWPLHAPDLVLVGRQVGSTIPIGVVHPRSEPVVLQLTSRVRRVPRQQSQGNRAWKGTRQYEGEQGSEP